MQRGRRYGFVAKAVAAAMLVVVADVLFWQGAGFGSNLGLFAACWLAAVVLVIPAVRHDRRALVALFGAGAMTPVLGDDPSLLAFALFCSALAIAVLLPRVTRFEHVGRWAQRLLLHVPFGLIGTWRDLLKVRRLKRRGAAARTFLKLLPLPLAGTTVFVALFSAANPVIERALAGIDLFDFDVVRIVFALIVLTLVWAALRPARITLRSQNLVHSTALPPGVTVGSVTLSLIAFNAVFALQNALDIAFLWSGASLPEGVSMTEYVHRGAYPLIVTALLAGLFVLVALRPGTATANARLIRRLVVLWVLQNVVLVVSSVIRTLDYIDAFQLTVLRIAALLWMGLVATGLVLIVWRMLRARSAGWLINANAITAGVVLTVASVVDLGATAATWNVRHAREIGGHGSAIDLCYLGSLGPSALTALVELETQHKLTPHLADRVAAIRARTLADVLAGQRIGRWTWRNARRVEQARASVAASGTLLRRPLAAPDGRDCDGGIVAPPPVIVVPNAPPQPLTKATPQ